MRKHHHTVESKSRYLIAAKLTNKTAKVAAPAATAAFRRIPIALRYSLILDNGKEFARYRGIEKDTGLTVYFADPYSEWQHVLLRRYFPGGLDFRNFTQKALAEAVKKLNHRPRKCLSYRMPYEVLPEAGCDAVTM